MIRILGSGRIWVVLSLLLCAFYATNSASQKLIVSNYPEEISEPGQIFEHHLDQHITQLIYYHKNIAKDDLYLAVILQNKSDRTITMNVNEGFGGPDLDGLFAGHIATREFFNTKIAKDTEVVTLKPREIRKIVTQKVKPRHISTGIIRFDISPQNRGLVDMKMVAVDGLYSHLSPLNEPLKSPYKVVEYDTVDVFETIFYEYGAPIKELPIGTNPKIVDPKSNIFLKGNYGVMYNFDITIKNPLSSPKTVNIYFSSPGGMARGNFVVDKKRTKQTGFLSRKSNYKPERLFKFPLKPFETKTINIITMPQAGSYYPVQLVLQSEV